MKNKKQQNKITSYNIFIKDSFNVIYNRPSLGFLPDYIKNVIINYRNQKAYLIVIELAKIWNIFNNQNIVFKYKNLTSKYNYFTNSLYENMIIDKKNILNKINLCLNFKLSIIYILCFYKFLANCLGNTKINTNILPTQSFNT